jgi:AraC-like DNA-binding protein
MESKNHAFPGRNVRAQIPGILRLYEIGHREVLVRPELQASLPAFVCSAGFREETNASYCQHGLRQEDTEVAVIQYTLSGRGRLRFEDRDMFVEPGQVMLVNRPHDHCCWLAEDERWEFFYVTLGGPGALKGVREAIAKFGPVVTLAPESTTLARLAETCAAVLDERLTFPHSASELAYGLVMSLLDAGTAHHETAATAGAPVPKFVQDVEEFCRTNLTRPIGVDDLARVAKMSRFHFTRKFEKARGISPGRYLAGLRLEESLRLISGGSHTVKRVAEECGFGDANYFCKVFRRSFGVSPGAFRTGIVRNRMRTEQAER